MNQEIRDYFAKNMVASAHALNTVQVKGIVQMLFAERHKPIVTFDQIGNDDVAVVVSVDVENAENRVGLMLRQNRHDKLIRAKKQNCGEGNPFFVGVSIFQDQSGATEKLFVRHAKPRMVRRPRTSHFSRAVN